MNIVAIPHLYTERETARMLGVSVATLRRVRNTGNIRCRRISERIIKYTDSDISDYIERGGPRK